MGDDICSLTNWVSSQHGFVRGWAPLHRKNIPPPRWGRSMGYWQTNQSTRLARPRAESYLTFSIEPRTDWTRVCVAFTPPGPAALLIALVISRIDISRLLPAHGHRQRLVGTTTSKPSACNDAHHCKQVIISRKVAVYGAVAATFLLKMAAAIP